MIVRLAVGNLNRSLPESLFPCEIPWSSTTVILDLLHNIQYWTSYAGVAYTTVREHAVILSANFVWFIVWLNATRMSATTLPLWRMSWTSLAPYSSCRTRTGNGSKPELEWWKWNSFENIFFEDDRTRRSKNIHRESPTPLKFEPMTSVKVRYFNVSLNTTAI